MTNIDPAPVPSPFAKIKENEITNSCNVTKLIDASRYRSLKKLLKVTAFVLKFITTLRNHVKQKSKNTRNLRNRTSPPVANVLITADELNKSKLLWIQGVQGQYFCDTSKFQSLKKQLGLFFENGTWRCGGRMMNAEMNYDMKFPYLLPKTNILRNWLSLMRTKKLNITELKKR